MNTSRRSLDGLDYLLIAVVMGLMGAFYWAIRGTGGFGGAAGGTFAGFGWALLWLAFSRHGPPDGERRPYSNPWMLWAITLGIAFGGLTGYGVYISWLNGEFYLNHPEGMRTVGAWTGYTMLFVCGLHWGGNTGCFMAWCAPRRKVTWKGWLIRIGCGIAGAVAAGVIVRVFPQWFLPFYDEGLYSVDEYATCRRALGSIRNIAPHVGLAAGFLGYELARKDWRAAGMILVMALGFAIPFTVGGYWQTMHGSELRIDWWKNWEMTIGLGGGLAFGLAFYLFNLPGEAPPSKLGPKARAFFQTGFPVWLPLAVILLSTYSGVTGHFGIERSARMGHALIILSLCPFLIASFLGKGRRLDEKAALLWLSLPAICVFQFLLIIAGYLVSIHPELRLANNVLLTLYTIYIGLSVVAAGIFAYRRRA
ncbi:MAG: hypothetical protein R6V12_02755 [Candidatus Hydrogenedentota bacterium]